MSPSFFHDPQVVPDLLSVCQGEGWISAKVAKKAQLMVEHGLHPEQALIGTGLVSIDQYGEALTHLFDIPFVRVPQIKPRRASPLTEELLKNYRAAIVDQDPKRLHVAFVDPSDPEVVRILTRAAQERGCSLSPTVTLWADVCLTSPRPASLPSLGRLRRSLQEALGQAGTSVLEAETHAHHWHTYEEGVQPLPPLFSSFSPAAVQALALHLGRYAKQDIPDWRVESQPTSEGTRLRLTRTAPLPPETHPLDWSQAFQSFVEGKSGVCVLIRSGEEEGRRRQQHGWMEKDLWRHWREQPKMVHVYPGRTEEEREEIVHAALSGRPVVVTQAHADVAWLKPVASLRIPLYILERHVVPQGMAWTAHLV